MTTPTTRTPMPTTTQRVERYTLVVPATVGVRRVALMPDEVPVMLRGEIPPDLADKLEHVGFRLPPRGTRPYTLELPRRGGAVTPEVVTLHCRRAGAARS